MYGTKVRYNSKGYEMIAVEREVKSKDILLGASPIIYSPRY